MADIKYLYETINTQKEALKNFSHEIFKIPKFITDNLKHSFFDWQKEALENFLFYQNPKSKLQKSPTHLMFNMATGTGKTLLMASAILYYYKQGYRHFLFFVNQNNIVDKTENNFINNTHNKYLFTEKIIIDDKTINIKKVSTFSDNPTGIEIKFTSIQKLYNDIHIQKENQTTLDDLHNKNIVMLGDEAHHLNTDTSKKSKQTEIIHDEITGRTNTADIEKKGWEHTVIELILNKNNQKGINKNILLEFTATIPAAESIAKKYEDKIIYKFGLKEFLQAGYTKEINLFSSTLEKKERILQALLFAWYRHKIALKYNISNFKPVILFRSKTIAESRQDYEDFSNWINALSGNDFAFIEDIFSKIQEPKQQSLYEQEKSRTQTLLEFIQNENINFGEIAEWIQRNYQAKNTIITNSKTNTTKSEKTDAEIDNLLNSLEDKNNHIRAIFTVDRLTEGWDVLNLFDIVRLYQGQNTGGSTKNTPESTTKEKQLIGRGVRYFPFSHGDTIKNKRKFDDTPKHELRVLEELYYYTYDEESRYISHLKDELRKDGYVRDDRVIKTFALKEEFQKSDFYKNVKIWYNKQIPNPNRRKNTLNDIKEDFTFTYKIKGLELSEQEIDLESKEDTERLYIQEKGLHTIAIKCQDIEKHIFQKVINTKAKQENSLMQFEKIKEELAINSIEELQTKVLADFNINITLDKTMNYDDITNQEKLKIVTRFLDKIFAELKENIAPNIGSEFVAGDFKKFFNEPKTKTITEDSDSQNLERELANENWYVLDSFHGTDQEIALVKFIKETIGNLEERYKEIYLLRNEEIYKIYDFKKGRGFQPDFILFLQTKEKHEVGVAKTELYYQIFIEPKQENYMTSKNEIWKEQFLEEISEKYGLKNVIRAENPLYRLIGLPFFNTEKLTSFEAKYQNLFA